LTSHAENLNSSNLYKAQWCMPNPTFLVYMLYRKRCSSQLGSDDHWLGVQNNSTQCKRSRIGLQRCWKSRPVHRSKCCQSNS